MPHVVVYPWVMLVILGLVLLALCISELKFVLPPEGIIEYRTRVADSVVLGRLSKEANGAQANDLARKILMVPLGGLRSDR